MSELSKKFYLASCAEGVKEALLNELDALGACEVRPYYRAVSFQCSEESFYKMHLALKTASQLYSILASFRPQDPKQLYHRACKLPWHELFSSDKSFRVDSVLADKGSEGWSGNLLSKQLRLAVEKTFEKAGKKPPKVELKKPQVILLVHLRDGRVSLCLNTSGKALHKRGYRSSEHAAPLKETLAAALISYAGYDGSKPLLDPMCGSGTLAIEAAYTALGKACNIHRKKGQFAIEHLSTFDKDLWRKVQEELRRERLEAPPAKIYASDQDENATHLARKHAQNARVEPFIEFRTASFFDIKKPEEHGIIVSNLPYGTRISPSEGELGSFYHKVGCHLKFQFEGWRAYLLVDAKSPWKKLGLKPSQRWELDNGGIPTLLLGFELFKGSRKAQKKPDSIDENNN